MTADKIAIIGAMGAGKDATAGFLALEYGHVPFAFASELKRHIREIYDVHDPARIKAIAQRLDAPFREIELDVWVNAMQRKIDRLKPERVVVTDTRRWNEYERLKKRGYTFIRVEASIQTRLKRIEARDGQGTLNERSFEHVTETEQDDFEAGYTINNNGDFHALAAQVDDIMAEVSE